MKKIIQFFTPSFLKKIDQKLLEKHPFLWSKRLAHVAFFGSLILGIHILVASLYPISIYSYTQLWVFLWGFTIPSVLFILIWLFFQYKYDLTWDHGRIKWIYYFGTGLSYVSVVVLCFSMVLLPAGIYQYRVNEFYDNNLSIDKDARYNENYLANKYLTVSSYEDDLSRLEPGSEEYLMAKEHYVNTFMDNLDHITPSHESDTLIMPGIETIYVPDPLLVLSQSGDSMKKYKNSHLWIVRLNKNTGNGSLSGDREGTLNMFSPKLFFARNQNFVYGNFDSSSYSFRIFFDEYLQSEHLPETYDEDTAFNWSRVLSDSSYYIESQKVKFFDKKETGKITDHRLTKTYPTYIFITKLLEQDTQYEDNFVGIDVRGQNLLLAPSDFYTLKRLEYFLFKRFAIESLEHVTPEIVNEHAEELQEFGKLIGKMERDYGTEFVYYGREAVIVLLITLYIVSAVLALILLTLRLLNFRLLVISLLGLAILSFILFVPLVGFRVNAFEIVPFICLSLLYGFFIFSIIRILYAKGTSLFMRVAALSGLIVLPLIVFFYFSFYTFVFLSDYYSESRDALFSLGVILIGLFLVGHIPLMARIIHGIFYLPKK